MDRDVRTPQAVAVPPHARESELLVVGALVMEPDGFHSVADTLAAEDFYDTRLGRVYATMAAVHADYRVPDTATLLSELGADFEPILVEAVQATPCESFLGQHAAIVRERAEARALLSMADKAKHALLGGAKPGDVAAEARHAIDAAEGASCDAFATMAEAGAEAMASEESRPKPVRSGLFALDGAIGGGMRPGQMVVVGARPGAGKTALACHLFLSAANEGLRPVLASYEMSRGDLWLRMACGEAQVPMQRVLDRTAPEDALIRLGMARARLDRLEARIAFKPRLRLDRLFAASRRFKAGLVIVDYIQLVPMPEADTRERQVAEASRICKLAAQELGAVVVVCAQLNRGMEHRGPEAKPRLSDLRESGALEQDADIVLLLDREELRPSSGRVRKGVLGVGVAKNRNGPVGQVELFWDGPTMSIGQAQNGF